MTYYDYMDEQVQVKLAVKCGLCVPKSSVKEGGDASIKFDSFPCICKSLGRIAGQKSQICIYQDQEELNKGLKSFGIQARAQVQMSSCVLCTLAEGYYPFYVIS